MFYRRIKDLCNKYDLLYAFGKINGGRITYRQFLLDIDKYRKVFYTMPHKRIAMIGAGSYEWVCQVYGALSVGKDIIPLDPYQNITNLTAMLQYAEADVILHDEIEDEFREAFSKEIHAEYRGYISQEEIDLASDTQVTDQDGTMMFFTSGTNSRVRGTVIDLERFWNSLEPGIPGWVENTPFQDIYYRNKEFGGEKDCSQAILYIPIPMQAIYGTCMCLLHLMQGFCIYFGNPRRFIIELESVQPDIMVGVASMIQILLQFDKPANLKMIMSSGGPYSEQLYEEAKEKGYEIRNIYGASEIGGVAFNPYGKSVSHMVPLAGNEIKIDDDGRIWLRSANMMLGYYKMEKATAELYNGEWCTLGDIGGYYEDGTFHIDGRENHMIAMANGSKLYLEEIEEALSAYPEIEEAGIMYLNQRVVAAIVPAANVEEALVRQAVQTYNRDQEFQFKIAEIWFRKEALPRLELGKLARKKLKEQYENEHPL